MTFIEMTGKTLDRIIKDDELHHLNLGEANVNNDTIVRVNKQGDIEVRRHASWDVIGGLLGEFEYRIQELTGLDWA